MQTSAEKKTYALFRSPKNRRIAGELERRDFKIFQFEPAETAKINQTIDLHDFDWIIFADVFAVDYFLEILNENEIDFFELDELRALACGEAVADRLRFVQLHADVVPRAVEIETIFRELLNYLGSENLRGLKFLVSCGEEFGPELKDKLIAASADVAQIAVYKIETPEKTASLKALLKGGAIDEFVFCAPEEIVFLRHYLYKENPSEIFAETAVSAADETTFQALRENGLRPRFFHISNV